MHHKFVVIDFDKPTARVYMGSYNFSTPADIENGENLLLIRDRRIAVSYMVEALAHLRSLPLPGGRAAVGDEGTAAPGAPAAAAGRGAVVEGGLHRSQEDQG